LLVGDGDLRQSLQSQVDAAHLGEHVHFLGSRGDVPAILSASDLFVLPSLWEGLPMALIEAMASGLPVVAPPAGGVADHLRHEMNGIAVPPYDVDAMASAIVELTLDVTRRRRLAEGARRTALALDWEVELDRLDASYRGVLGLARNPTTQSRAPTDIFDERAARSAAC
jgi:glycosyltransferase involved in cell wall biosynthesis